jgi:hypothetical protein
VPPPAAAAARSWEPTRRRPSEGARPPPARGFLREHRTASPCPSTSLRRPPAVVVRVAVWNQAQTQRRVDLFVSPGGMEEVVVGQLQRVRRRVVSSGCSRSSAWWGASISIICSKASLWKPHEPAFSAKPSSSSTLTASMLAPAPSSSRSSVESQRARFCPRGDDTTSSMGLVDAASRSMAVARVRVQLCRGGFGIAGWIRLIGGDAGGKATRCGGRGVLWPVSSSWTCVGLGRVH